MVDLFKSVFDDEMFSDIYFVDEIPAVVSVISISKRDGHLFTEEKETTFELNSVADGDTFDLKHRFFVRMNFQWRSTPVKYFSGGILASLFGRRNPRRIADMIADYDWAFATDSVLAEMKKLDDCRLAESDLVDECTEMKPVLYLMGTTVYRIPDDVAQSHGMKSTLYVGFRRSMTAVLHRTENRYCLHVNEDNGIKKFELV